MQDLSNWKDGQDYVIANVVVVDPSADKTFPGFVGIKQGKITFVESGEPQIVSIPIYDGKGLHLAPGFVDIHVHLREPGHEYKEDIEKMMEGLKGEIQSQAEREVRLAFILNTVADQEKIEVATEEVSAKIEQILAQTDPSQRKQFGENLRGPYKDQIRSEIKDTKIFDWLIEHAKIKSVTGGSK